MNQNEQYDAIVVGTGISGGWAAKELCENGFKTMGWNPRTSVVNLNNQLHDVPNVYFTDGAFMTSASFINPSLTYMAFTERAANHAADQFKSGNFS